MQSGSVSSQPSVRAGPHQRRALLMASGAMLASTLLSCAVRRAPMGAPPAPCLALDEPAAQSGWILRHAADERSALDAWCWAVGPAVVSQAGTNAAGAIDRLAVVVWNAHVGNGDLARLLSDLRSGVITGQPERDFIVLLQEVHRAGVDVPRDIPAWAVSTGRHGGRHTYRMDVVALARQAGLAVVYAPSMRNGSPSDGGPPEDRGNAILSTLPLTDPSFVELPYERQRRVAVLASAAGRTSSGESWQLRFASVHLDNRARIGRIHRSFGAARERQAESVVEILADAGPAVVGGDLNTWEAQSGAAAVRTLRMEFPLPERPPVEGTLDLPWGLPALRLDHLFFRLPDGWEADYRVLENDYGSDHQPLLGWIHMGDSARAGTHMCAASGAFDAAACNDVDVASPVHVREPASRD